MMFIVTNYQYYYDILFDTLQYIDKEIPATATCYARLGRDDIVPYIARLGRDDIVPYIARLGQDDIVPYITAP
jgi:hypothetical protein